MNRLLHPKCVWRAFYYGMRWRVRKALRIPEKTNLPVLNSGLDSAVKRHLRICETLLKHLPEKHQIEGRVVAEIGCGDCLAAADMMLGLGASHVHLVEYHRIHVTSLHREILKPLIESPKVPNRGEILTVKDPPTLNPEKATAHQGLLENLQIKEQIDFVYSFDVVEHVEDLDGFFGCCSRMLRPGGLSLHKFDLSGHEFFEDPMPPLDFQTYPTWLFNIIFPKYRRAVGNFADTIFDSMKKNGLEIQAVIPIRTAEPDYLEKIWPKLRKEARRRDRETMALLDVIVLTKKIS